MSMRILLWSLSGFWRISTGQGFLYELYRDFYNRSIGIQRGSKGFLYGFYMDFYVESLGNQWESRGFLNGFCMSFYKDARGISVRILLAFNEIISI